MLIIPEEHSVRRNDVEDVPLEASEEMLRQLAARGNVEATIEVIEAMEEFGSQQVSDIYSGHFLDDKD